MSAIIELSQEELRKLQLIELEMLIEVDRICRKHNIHYSLTGGTLIGAVRHKGFIPWDDDLDVMFIHEEYERFYEACKTDLDTSRFFFQDYRTDPHYLWGYGKMRRIGTEYIKSGQESLKQKTGVCIDLFNFSNVPDSRLKRKFFHTIMFCIRKTLYSEMGRHIEKSRFLRMWYSILSCIPSRFVNNIRLKIVKHYQKKQTANVSCSALPIPYLIDGFDKKVFEEYTYLPFENREFMATAHWDYYLSAEYGDYMQLPKEENRRGVMNAVVYQLIDPQI